MSDSISKRAEEMKARQDAKKIRRDQVQQEQKALAERVGQEGHAVFDRLVNALEAKLSDYNAVFTDNQKITSERGPNKLRMHKAYYPSVMADIDLDLLAPAVQVSIVQRERDGADFHEQKEPIFFAELDGQLDLVTKFTNDPAEWIMVHFLRAAERHRL